MKFLKFVFVVFLFFGCNSDWQNFNNQCVEPKGNLIRKNFQIEKFDKLVINTNLNVVFSNKNQKQITVNTYSNFFDYIDVQVVDSVLYVKSSECLLSDSLSKVIVPFSYLKEIEVNGKSNLIFETIKTDTLDIVINGFSEIFFKKLQANYLNLLIRGNSKFYVSDRFSTDHFRLTVSGFSQLELTKGRIDKDLIINVLGNSEMDFGKVSVRKAEINIKGNATINLQVKDTLRSQISGKGVIKYLGAPKIISEIYGFGKIQKI